MRWQTVRRYPAISAVVIELLVIALVLAIAFAL